MQSTNPESAHRKRLIVLTASVFLLSLCLGTLFILQPWRASPNSAVSSSSEDAPLPESRRLVVLVAFDQMRADYLNRWGKLYGDDGFHRLTTDGTWFTNCNYPYACTETAPGHATMVTGRMPSSHGIVGNVWYDRDLGSEVWSVAGSRRYKPVPTVTARPSSPENLVGPTIGDMVSASGHKGRVVSLAGKDRSAIPMGGHKPDACYWFDTSSGQYITSSYYRSSVHSWVADFNASHPTNRWLGKDWTRLRSDLDYAAYTGPDVTGEDLSGAWRSFPHPLTVEIPGRDGKEYDKRAYYEKLYASPFANELLLDLAKRAIKAENLGRSESPDLLCLSFSATDAIGHMYGPDSQEVLDGQLRADRIVADLLGYLNEQIGRDHYVMVLTSDHGVCPLPEVTNAKEKDHAYRVVPKQLKDDANEMLQKTYAPEGTDRWIELAENWFYLDQRVLKDHGLKRADVENKLIEWLKDYPGILTAYSRTQLLAGLPRDDPIGQMVQRSFCPDRCGDVVAIMKPGSILWSFKTGTTHGTPHEYDSHVPLLVYGPDIPAKICTDPVTPLAVAPILAAALRVDPPAGADTPIPPCLILEPGK